MAGTPKMGGGKKSSTKRKSCAPERTSVDLVRPGFGLKQGGLAEHIHIKGPRGVCLHPKRFGGTYTRAQR